jgi:hypothetical protein
LFAQGFLTFVITLGKLISATLPDLLFVGGVVLVVWGVHLWSISAAFVVGGMIAMAVGAMMIGGKK